MLFSKCPTTIAFDGSGNTHVIYCGKWSCSRCQKRLARQWAQRARIAQKPIDPEAPNVLFFLTLTLGSDVKTTSEGFSAIPLLWDATRKAYQRFYETFSYLAFVEGQPKRSGMPHFHILTWEPPPIVPNKNNRVTKHMLHDWAFNRGWGFQIELEEVTPGQAASYVAKYATKQSKFTPKHFRRVRCSKDWPAIDRDKLQAWYVPIRNETGVDFVLRVSEATGIEPDDLYPKYIEVQNELYALRKKISS